MLHTTLLNILLPPICVGCNKEGFFICLDCTETIETYKYLVCPVCKRRDLGGRLDESCRKTTNLTRFFSAVPYSDEIIRKSIYALKYNFAKDLSSPLSEMLIDFLDKNNFEDIISDYKKRLALIPVPLYNFRHRQRGFNQSAELARLISKRYEIEVLDNSLIKHRNTEQQVNIKNRSQKALNVSESFTCKYPEAIQNKIVALVDDVYTTGSTMRECAKILRDNGAAQIWGITVAKG